MWLLSIKYKYFVFSIKYISTKKYQQRESSIVTRTTWDDEGSMYFLWHFYSSISAAISLRSVYCCKKKTSKAWIFTSIEVFLTSRQRWASPRCFHQRHSQEVTESHMCFICHNKVAGVFAVALIQLTTTLSTLTTLTTPTAPIIPKWLLRLLLLKKCFHSRRWLMITIFRKKQSNPPESLTTEERAFPEELFSASWVPN